MTNKTKSRRTLKYLIFFTFDFSQDSSYNFNAFAIKLVPCFNRLCNVKNVSFQTSSEKIVLFSAFSNDCISQVQTTPSMFFLCIAMLANLPRQPLDKTKPKAK